MYLTADRLWSIAVESHGTFPFTYMNLIGQMFYKFICLRAEGESHLWWVFGEGTAWYELFSVSIPEEYRVQLSVCV